LKHRLVGLLRVALINVRVNAQGTEECSVGHSDDTIALNSRNSRYTTEEHAADNRIRTRVLYYLELDVSLHIPNQIFAVVEAAACGNSPAVQNRAGHRVAHPDGLGTLGAIPIERIERDLMRVAIGQVHIDCETAPHKPRSGNAVARVLGLLQGRQSSRGSRPCPVGLPAEGD